MLNTLCVVVFFCVSYLVSAGVITTRQPDSKEYSSTIRQYSTGTINRQRSTFEPENTHNITLCNDGRPTEVLLGGQTSVTVRSPNFGDGDYPPNSRCKVVFRTGEKAMMVLLQFNAFDLELAMDFDSCDYDWLCVNGVKFCGDWASNRIFEYLIPARRTFTLYFSTDVSVAKSGFEAVIEAYTAALNRTVNIPSSGVGVGEKKITYISTALSSDFTEKYKDKCDRTGYYSIVINDSRTLSTQPTSTRRDY